jgi:hypothetical protein
MNENFPNLEVCCFPSMKHNELINVCQKYLYSLPNLLFVKFNDHSINFR